MLKPSKKVEYALMALKYMSEESNGKLVSAREVCEKFHTPFDTTAKVMQTLNNASILHSVKGVKGGYSLSKDLSNISYYDLITVIEGDSFNNYCQGLSLNGLCERHSFCNISGPINNLGNEVAQFLKKISLNKLLSGPLDNIDLKLNEQSSDELFSKQETIMTSGSSNYES